MKQPIKRERKQIRKALQGAVSNRQNHDGWMLMIRERNKQELIEATFTRTREACRRKREALQGDLFNNRKIYPVKVRMQFVVVP